MSTHARARTSGFSHVSVCRVLSYLSMENSMVFREGSRPTANWGWPWVSVILIRCQRLRDCLRFRNVVTKLNCSGRPWLNTRLWAKNEPIINCLILFRTYVAVSNDSRASSLCYSQCWHEEIGRRVDPVSSLHPVGAPHPGHTRVSVQIHVQLELADEVKVLEIILSGLVICARVSILRIA